MIFCVKDLWLLYIYLFARLCDIILYFKKKPWNWKHKKICERQTNKSDLEYWRIQKIGAISKLLGTLLIIVKENK